MSPSALADVRASLSRYTLDEARRFAETALAASGAAEARSAVTAAIASPKEN
jgi:phosphotransferase system enzyme I (PtsI)